MMRDSLSRREALLRLAGFVGGTALPSALTGCREVPREMGLDPASTPAAEVTGVESEDQTRFYTWIDTLRREGLDASTVPFGLTATRVGELSIGTPYEGATLEEYIRAGGSPVRTEPLTLSLTRFDCVSLVESCIAIARVVRGTEPVTWEAFATEMERMRYRDGVRGGYATRLHYFSDWIQDNERRGLVQGLTRELSGVADDRPLRFMSRNPDAYPAMADPRVREEIAAVERSLDIRTRWIVPTARIPAIAPQLQSGDILGFSTSIDGLDVSHAAFAYRDGAAVRVLHAPLSGGVVEITRATVQEYVGAIRLATGILVARPLQG